LGLEAAQVGEDGAPPAPGDPCALPGLRGFGDSGTISSAAFRLLARVFDAPALAPTDGSLTDSPLGDQVETVIARKGMSPSNPRMGEIKLSKACIQMYKYKITRR
jgi:hypothetical protein